MYKYVIDSEFVELRIMDNPENCIITGIVVIGFLLFTYIIRNCT